MTDNFMANTYKFYELSQEIQENAFEEVFKTNLYWNYLAKAMNRFLQDKFGQRDYYDWTYDGTMVYFDIPTNAYDRTSSAYIEDTNFINNKISEIYDEALSIVRSTNNPAVQIARFDANGKIVRFM